MTMAERMARAHHAKMRELVPATRVPFPSWEELSDNTRNMQIECARAVLEAMREPTPKMLKVGADAIDHFLVDADGTEIHAWHAMIDAALKD
jgi:hypothetical protein